ncbi:MAG: FAD-dependent oxidoreductase, partial [Lachnospiraceae bacterium]|nr:FAD-dependent oxidoreductase [Lachnospiraceae bacterium]
LHVSAGLRTDFNMKYLSYWFQNYLMDHCFNVHYARDIKKRYPDLLVNTVGSIMSLDYAEEIIANGWADFVAMCRPLMADPDMPRKYAENRSEDRRPCLRCNTCTKHLFVPKPIWCAVNPISGMANELSDGVVPKTPVKKRVAIAGGGPGGIQAMQTLLDRGHDVTLYEKTDHLGGNVIGAAAPPFKVDIQDYLKWMVHTAKQCEERGARILMNTPCTKEILDKENYDAVVIAVGGEPIVPENIPGIHKPHVVWAPDAELGKVPAGEEIVIIGAGQVGLEAAVDYAGQGKKITVIEMIDDPAKLMDSFKQPLMKKKEEDGLQIDILYGTALQEVKDDCIVAKDVKSGELKEIKADTVLLAMGIRPNFELVDELRHSCAETSVAIVGDCNDKAGSISEAVNQAFQACLHI